MLVYFLVVIAAVPVSGQSQELRTSIQVSNVDDKDLSTGVAIDFLPGAHQQEVGLEAEEPEPRAL